MKNSFSVGYNRTELNLLDERKKSIQFKVAAK